MSKKEQQKKVATPIPGSVDPDTGDKDQRNKDSQQPESKEEG